MKAQNTILSVLTFVFLIGCASTGQNSDIKMAEDVDLYLYDSETPSFLAVDPDITIFQIFRLENGKQNEVQKTTWGANNHIISSGEYTFFAQYNAHGYISDPILFAFTFESGKSYKLNYEIIKEVTFNQKGEIRVFVDETPPNDAIKNYLAFSEANPHYLDGVWAYSRKYPYENIEITFDGRNFTTTGFNRVSKIKIVREGIYFYNENTIILYCKKDHGLDTLQREILTYELEGGILHIKSGGNSAVVTIGGLKGDYNKK